MDAADVYVVLYDTLVECDLVSLSDWAASEETKAMAREVTSVVEAQGEVPDESWNAWLPAGPARTQQTLGVLLGLDRALLNADSARDSLPGRELGHLRSRLEISGKINLESSGILLFRRATPCRPNVEPQHLDGFLHLVRIPAHFTGKITVVRLPELDDLPDLDNSGNDGELQPGPRLPIAQLPMLAEAGDIIWDRVDNHHPTYKFYSVRPDNSKLTPRIHRALGRLDESGAVLALLPEASLDDAIFEAWRQALSTTPRPSGSRLTWLLIGSGPVMHGPQVCGDRPPNRAVLMHRNGRCLITQDKRRGFCFTVEQQRRYHIDLGCKRDEYISPGRSTCLIEARQGRFAVHICEDLNRADMRDVIITSGVTHLMIPVLAGGMWSGGWQADNAFHLAEESGTNVAISNGLAIERSYDGGPVPTLLVCSAPEGPQEDYLTRGEVMREVHPESASDDPCTDALTVRKADW
jgi:hypothetical protein